MMSINEEEEEEFCINFLSEVLMLITGCCARSSWEAMCLPLPGAFWEVSFLNSFQIFMQATVNYTPSHPSTPSPNPKQCSSFNWKERKVDTSKEFRTRTWKKYEGELAKSRIKWRLSTRNGQKWLEVWDSETTCAPRVAHIFGHQSI